MPRITVVLLFTLAVAIAGAQSKKKSQSIDVGTVKVDLPKAATTNFDYVAETAAPVAQSGNVVAGTLQRPALHDQRSLADAGAAGLQATSRPGRTN